MIEVSAYGTKGIWAQTSSLWGLAEPELSIAYKYLKLADGFQTISKYPSDPTQCSDEKSPVVLSCVSSQT